MSDNESTLQKELLSDPGTGVKRAPDQSAEDQPAPKKSNVPSSIRELADGETRETLLIPDQLVGLVIGRGGENIERVQSTTKCEIQVFPSPNGSKNQPCTLTGVPDAVVEAKKMLQETIANGQVKVDENRKTLLKPPDGSSRPRLNINGTGYYPFRQTSRSRRLINTSDMISNEIESFDDLRELDEYDLDSYRFNYVLGRGGFAKVLAGLDSDKKRAFKVIEIDRQNESDIMEEIWSLQKAKSSRMIRLYDSFRLCIALNNHPKFASLIGEDWCFTNYQTKNFAVLVTEYCDGDLRNRRIFNKHRIDEQKILDNKIEICRQLIEAAAQLLELNISHNDLKPSNIFYRLRTDNAIELKVGDFGAANRPGGTPGWTSPKFMDISRRQPGKSDLYSIALLILYVMCESDELFYCLRDNYVEPDINLKNFHKNEVIEVVMIMLHSDDTIDVYKQEFEKRSPCFQILRRTHLMTEYQIRGDTLCIGNGKKQNLNYSGSVTAPNPLLVITDGSSQDDMQSYTHTLTKTLSSAENELCWLKCTAKSIQQSMQIKKDSIQNTFNFEIDTDKFFRRSMIEIICREICFGLIPKPLTCGKNQQHDVDNVFKILDNKGFLRDRGILSLEFVKKFYDAIHEDPSIELKMMTLLDYIEKMENTRYSPVMSIVKQGDGHSVILNNWKRVQDLYEERITIYANDAENVEYAIHCRIVDENDIRKLEVDYCDNDWCLASDKCYFCDFI